MKNTTTSNKRPIDFLSGWPSPTLLPPLQLETGAHSVLSNLDIATQSLKYGPDEGYLPLREEIAQWLTKFYAPKDTILSERITITGGASQNLACVLQTFTDPVYTRNIWMVTPTYFLACRVFDDNGFSQRLKGVPEDEEGIDIDFLSKRIEESEQKAVSQGNTIPRFKTPYPWRKTYKHVIYAVPTFANPSGRLMSLRRREQLVALARKYDALIITDDVYDMLQWPSSPNTDRSSFTKAVLPRIVDIDRYLEGGPISDWGNALSNGSFSKIIAPGCRTGWAEACPKLAWGLSQCGSSRSGGAPSHLVASIIHQMIVKGDLDRHMSQTLLPSYEKRFQRMMQAVQSHLIPLGLTIPQPNKDVAGGYFIWLTLPASLNAELVRKRVQTEENVTIITGPKCTVAGDDENEANRFDQNIRLCFTFEEYDLLDEGVARLARVIKSFLKT